MDEKGKIKIFERNGMQSCFSFFIRGIGKKNKGVGYTNGSIASISRSNAFLVEVKGSIS
jgi:hypothetical protein